MNHPLEIRTAGGVRRRRPWTAYLLFFILFLDTALPPSSHADPLPESGQTRLMSFNIRYGSADDGEDSWQHRRFLVRLTIRDTRPDIVALQECLSFQADELDQAFTEYAVDGVGRDDGMRAGEMCAVMYRRTRFELIEKGHFWLSETPDVPGSKGWDAACPRIVTWYRFHDRTCLPDTFVVANVHLDHVGTEARREGTALLQSRLKGVLRGQPLLLAGDFNSVAGSAGSEVWRLLVEENRRGLPLYDTWLRARPSIETADAGTFHGFDGVPERGRIDWILASPVWRVDVAGILRTSRDGRWPSDHFPVTADFHVEWRPDIEAIDAVTGATSAQSPPSTTNPDQ